MSDSLVVPGLPRLTWERRQGWRCVLSLPAWTDLLPEDEKGDAAEGDVEIAFACSDIYERQPPTPAQVAAVRGLLDRAAALRGALLRAVFDEFREVLDEQDWIAAEFGGPLIDPAQLLGRIAVIQIGVRLESEGESADLDLDCDCFWDHEHGFLATVRGGEVTYVGPR